MTKRRASATQQDQNYRVDSVRRELSKINGEVLYSIYMTGTRDDQPYVTYVQEINDNWRLWSDVVLRQSTQPLTVKISASNSEVKIDQVAQSSTRTARHGMWNPHQSKQKQLATQCLTTYSKYLGLNEKLLLNTDNTTAIVS